MAEEDGQERTEEPTPRRLEQAREKGQIPRSRELSTALLTLGGSVALAASRVVALGGSGGARAPGLQGGGGPT